MVGERGVGVAGRLVGVAAGGRLVGVGGRGVNDDVDVATRAGVSVGASAAVGEACVSTMGVTVDVAEADGLGVLVGVGVTAGGGATAESSGQVQLKVVIAATIAGASTFIVSLFKRDASFFKGSCRAEALVRPGDCSQTLRAIWPTRTRCSQTGPRRHS